MQRKKWFALFLGVVLMILLIGVFLGQKRLAEKNKQFIPNGVVSDTTNLPVEEKIKARTLAAPFVNSGEFVINPNSSHEYNLFANPGNIQNATAAEMVVEDIIPGKETVHGREVQTEKVLAKYNMDGKLYNVEFNIVDGVGCGHCDEDSIFPVNLSELKLNPGDSIGVVLVYLPKDNPLTLSGVEEYCEFTGDSNCWYALEHGFGQQPIEIGEYWANETAKAGDQKLVVDPANVFIGMVNIDGGGGYGQQ